MHYKSIIFIAFSALCFVCAHAQSNDVSDIYGSVHELVDNGLSKQSHPLPGVTVQLVAKGDTLYTTTDFQGVFLFKGISVQRISLKLHLLGKQTIANDFELEAGRNVFYFTMEDTVNELDASKISARGELMKTVADTTVFNTRLLNTIDGDSARALLEQLPGFRIEGGRITVDGEEIKRTYVNGVLFFGDIPTTALDALKANEVAEVKVFDELNSIDVHRGINHGKKDRVLDIKTLDSIISLTDAVALAEGGADENGNMRYQGLGATAFWSQMLNISAMAGADNISSDLSEMNMDFHLTPLEIAKSAQAKSSPLNIESESLAAKINLSKYWKDRNYGNKVSGTYSYGRNSLRSISNALTQYYETESNPFMAYFDTTSNTSLTKRHSFVVDADLHDTPLKSISLLAYGNITSQDESNQFIQSIVSDQIRLRNENSSSNNNNYDISLHAGWTDNDHERIRPALNLDAVISKENLISWVTDTLKSSYSRRHLHTDGNGNGQDFTATGSLSFTAINDETRSLLADFRYRFSYKNQVKKQLSIDYLDPEQSVTSIGGSYDYSWNYANNSISLGGTYATRDISLNGGLEFINSSMKGENRFPTIDPVGKTYNSCLPYLTLNFKNIQFKLGTRADLPALEQIRSHISDSNPMILSAGNPGLDKSYSTFYQLRWSKALKKNYGKLLLSSEGECTTSPIVASSKYFSEDTILSNYFGYRAQAGSFLYTYDNSSTPAWSLTTSATYSGIFRQRKLIFQSSLSGSFKSVPQYVGESITGINELRLSLSSSIRFNPTKRLKIYCSPLISVSSSTDYALTPVSKSVSVSAPLSLDLSFLNSCYLKFTNRFGCNHYFSGFGKDITTDFMSATIGRRFLGNSLTISISANDLLGSSTKYATETTAHFFKQNWTPAYGRYYLLSVIYELRNKQ